ncbi:MAG: hypothetical protein PHV03_03230 [Desulfitobacteriaceae bacterium]|nr:hypothetical protein [Desulfitobacteriaceae bacterium]
MRKVRRKTTDPTARTYLLKAKKEGLDLSWNRLEKMMPQDGFGLLGLTCQECLQGPCRLNPFQLEETATVCGFTRDDLVFNGLFRQVSKVSRLVETTHILLQRLAQKNSADEVDQRSLKTKADSWMITDETNESAGWIKKAWELTGPLSGFGLKTAGDRLSLLFAAAARYISLLKFNAELLELLNGTSLLTDRSIGLSNLQSDSINVCFDGVSPVVLDLAAEAAGELKAEAVNSGIPGAYNLLLVGDFSLNHDYNVVSNQGTVEFALLSGIVDLYLVGRESISRGRNLTGKFQTLFAECTALTTKDELKKLFRQAIESLKKRKKNLVNMNSDLVTVSIGYTFNPAIIENAGKKGIIKGLCIIASGSNVKVTNDEMAVKIAKSLSAQSILCLSYGNTAVTLGRYGCLAKSEQKAGFMEFPQSDLANHPVTYCLGGELAVSAAVELVQTISRLKVTAVFPEMTEVSDIQAALGFADAGAKVFTGVKLPLDGSEALSKELGEVIQYCTPEDITEKILRYFSQ